MACMYSLGLERVTEALIKALPYLRVIILTDISHSSDGLHVFIGLVRVNVVKGVGCRWIAIGCCEINANLNTHTKKHIHTDRKIHEQFQAEKNGRHAQTGWC